MSDVFELLREREEQIDALTAEVAEHKRLAREGVHAYECLEQENAALAAENERLTRFLEAAEARERAADTASLKNAADSLAARQALAEAVEARDHQRAKKDQAYEERNRLVALLASMFPSGRARTDIPGWNPEWHGAVYIDFPWGQASWHFHDSQAHLFEHLPPYAGAWDGHTTEEKYAAIAAATQAADPGQDEIEGFIILGPGFPAIAGCHTFGRTMTEAWERHMGPAGNRDIGERETLRSRWAQKGWRPVPAKLIVTRK